MDFNDLIREGSRPTIVPNAGLRRTLCWTNADCGRYGALLKQAFPGILFYEDFRHRDHFAEAPVVRFFERLDDPEIRRTIDAFIPYPGWKPELVQEESLNSSIDKYWTWAKYLSPRFSIDVRWTKAPIRRGWQRDSESGVLENWRAFDITTSYRRQLPHEAPIQAKAVRIAEKLCVKTVLIFWESEADFLAGRGRIWGRTHIGVRHVTPAVLDWYRAAPHRTIDLQVSPEGWGMSYLPLEAIPENWWDASPRRPKWAQR